MSEHNNKLIQKMMLLVLALVVLAFVALFYLRPLLVRSRLPKPVDIQAAHQPTMGDSKAKIHIVAFEDLKCGNCARFNNELMPYIKKHYIDTGIATYTMINLAFVPGSLPAANAARCLYAQNPAYFFPYIDAIFLHQPPENENWATIPALMDFADALPGVDTNELAGCIVSNTYYSVIVANLKQASRVMKGAVATPAVYINGVKVTPVTKTQFDLVMGAVR